MIADAAESEDVTVTDAWATMRLSNVTRLWSPWMHDLRQPMHTVSLNLELLSRSLARAAGDASQDEDWRRYLDVIRSRLDDLQKGLQTYTDLLRPASEEGRSRSFDAADLSREIETLVEPLAQRRGLEVELDAGATRVHLTGRRDAIRDLLLAAALEAVEMPADGDLVRLRVGTGGGRGFMEVRRPGAAPADADGRVDGTDVATSPSRPAVPDLQGLARDLVVPLGGTAGAADESGADRVLRIELPLENRSRGSSEAGAP